MIAVQILASLTAALLISLLVVLFLYDRLASRFLPILGTLALVSILGTFFAYILTNLGSDEQTLLFRGIQTPIDQVSETLSKELENENPGTDIWVEVQK